MSAERDREFLGYAKGLGGRCCVCWELRGETVRADELHHFGPKGMGQKGSDYLVARLCLACHHSAQGKRKIAFDRMPGGWEILAAMRADALEMLIGWVGQINRRHA